MAYVCVCALYTEGLHMCSLHMYTFAYSAGAPTVTNVKILLPLPPLQFPLLPYTALKLTLIHFLQP